MFLHRTLHRLRILRNHNFISASAGSLCSVLHRNPPVYYPVRCYSYYNLKPIYIFPKLKRKESVLSLVCRRICSGAGKRRCSGTSFLNSSSAGIRFVKRTPANRIFCRDKQKSSAGIRFVKSIPANRLFCRDKQKSNRTLARLQRASLTVEAALELPLFFLLCVIVLQYASVMRTACEFSGSLTTTAQEMAVVAYKKEYGDSNNVIRGALSDVWARSQVIDTAPDKEEVRLATFAGSSYMKNGDDIELVLTYQPKPKFALLSLPLTFFVQKAVVRGWTGRLGYSGENGGEDADPVRSNTVYVTDHGTVYHTNPDCSHLHVTIISITPDQLRNARNVSGHKYKKCPYCGNSGHGGLYVDPYGTSYHTSLDCPGLKRSVHETSLDECGHMHECADCRKNRQRSTR